MSLEVKGGGITKLSELIIDADKGWQGYGISNLESVVAAMAKGDLVYRNAAVLDRLPLSYGIGYNFLHALDSGVGLPEWLDIQDLIIFLTGAVNRAIAPPTLLPPMPSLSLVAAEDHSGGGLTATPPTLIVPMPTLVAPVATLSPGNPVDGFVMHDEAPTDTDQTAEANEGTANDMGLMPAALVGSGDGCYVGFATPWDWVLFNLGTAGDGTYTITWKYWNGAWVNASILYNETSNFKTTGYKRVHLNRPGDWALHVIAGLNLYWLYAYAVEGTMTIRPLGTQAWIGQY